MNVEEFREYCFLKNGVTEELPFNEETLVFKVSGKMFALCGLRQIPFKLSLKCDPEKALRLREEYRITGAYHMNKRHWNSIIPEALSPLMVRDMIDHSYDLVVRGLTKKQQQALQ